MSKMSLNDALRGIAGVMVLLSVALTIWVSPWFLAFTAFIGLNLLQSAFSGTCPMMWVLKKAGLRDSNAAGPEGTARVRA